MSKPLALIKSLDHLVLTCASVPKTIQWYSRHLGMKHETFNSPAGERQALKFGGLHKINLHQQGNEFEPKAATALPGTADLCFLVEDDTNLDQLVQDCRKEDIEVLEGEKVVDRTGARGKIRSVYVRDPDGNLIETHTQRVHISQLAPFKPELVAVGSMRHVLKHAQHITRPEGLIDHIPPLVVRRLRRVFTGHWG